MGGFLGLIEAFLAFALTMLALSTAVSAIVEVGYNLFRWRAKGLREMVAYLFRNEIQERLPKYKPLPPKPENKTDLAKWKKRLAKWKEKKKKWKEWSRVERIDFIFDITMVPNPQHDMADEEDVRKRQIERAEKYQGIPMLQWDNWVALPNLLLRIINWPFRLFFLWPSLKLGLSNLPAEDFETKFKASTAGKAIRKASSDRKAWEKTVKAVVDAFKRLEGPTTEHFRRKSRYFSIIVGFVLAFAVNIDSFNLLNSYLTDADLRASVIANADTYIKQAQADSIQVLQDSTTTQQFATKIDSLLQALEGISSGVLTEEEQAKLDSAIAFAKESRETATEMRRAIVGAAQQVRSIASNLTESFPIGWNRYPQCPENSPDTRCLVLAPDKKNVKPDSSAWPQWHISKPSNWDFMGINQGVFWVPTSIIMWPIEAVVWSYRYLEKLYDNDSPGFFQWFFGVFTTGILVGLGSPFWMRVVSQLLEAQRKAKGGKKNDEKKDNKT